MGSIQHTHDMPSGNKLKEMLAGWDFFEHTDKFTGTEMSQMYRASMGDYNWMYDKQGYPRAGWINLWLKKGRFIREQAQIIKAREIRMERKAHDLALKEDAERQERKLREQYPDLDEQWREYLRYCREARKRHLKGTRKARKAERKKRLSHMMSLMS